MTLVELMIAAGLSVLVMLLAGTQMRRSWKSESTARSSQDFSTTLASVLAVVQNTDICAGALVDASGNKIKIAGASVTVNEVLAHGTAGGAILSQKHVTITPTTQLDTMTVDSFVADGTSQVGGVTLNRFFAKLNIKAKQTIDGQTKSLSKAIPLTLLADAAGFVQTCGTPDTSASAGYGSVSPEMTVEFKSTGPYSATPPIVIDSAATKWTGDGVDVVVAGAEYTACFITGTLFDGDPASDKPLDAHKFRITPKADGVHFFYKGHYTGSPGNNLMDAKFRFRCLK